MESLIERITINADTVIVEDDIRARLLFVSQIRCLNPFNTN